MNDLEYQISEKSQEIRTDGYSMSIGEVISMYRDGDIEIHPEFQRIFRWEPTQKSRLIESILLGIPIPPIFVSQRADGVWDVIDGVQRLSTILEFTGNYQDESGKKVAPSTLTKTEYLPALEGFQWDSGSRHFNEVLQRDFKRSKLEFRIVTKQSDSNAKYDLFQRLNSGTHLSPQEARNCLLVMLNVDMFNSISTLASTNDFLQTVLLSKAKENEAYREELVLRFFMHAAYEGDRTELGQEFGEFLTQWMRTVATSGSYRKLIDIRLFKKVFKLLNSSLGDDAFRRYDGTRHLGPFSISAFEFVTAGLIANVANWQSRSDELRERVRSIWSHKYFQDNSGTGVSTRRRLPKLVNEAREFFEED